MKRILRTIPLFLLLLTLLTTTAFAAGELTAERTSNGMVIDGSVLQNTDGLLFCAVYDADGRMLAVEEVSDPSDILVYCDVNAVRKVNLFAFAENTFIPVSASADTTLEAPETPIHVHTWDNGTITAPATCAGNGVLRYSCTDAACDDFYEEDIPMLDHTWGRWRQTDADIHTRVCTMFADHTETAPHDWVMTEIIREPTYDREGRAAFSCPDCRGIKNANLPKLEPKEVWFTYDDEMETYMVNWQKADLPAGHIYHINGQPCYNYNSNYDSPVPSLYAPLFDLFYNSELTSGDLVISTGRAYSGQLTTLYTAEDAIQMTETEAVEFTLTGQPDGTYLVGADMDMTDMTIAATLFHNDGIDLVSEIYPTPYIDIYPWDGCTMELTATSYAISEDTEHLIITRTPTGMVTEFVRPETPADRTVTTDEELDEALTIGGTVTLGADITTNRLDIYGGEPVTLVLNGHTLDADLRTHHGKELTIDGTAEGSTITGELSVNCADKLTILGGSYGQLFCDWINTITMEDASFASESVAFYADNCFDITMTDCTITSTGNNAMNMDGGDKLTIEDSTITTTATSSDGFTRYEAMTVTETETIRLIDVTASSVSGSAAELSPAPAYGSNGELYTGSSVYIRGGSYTSECTNMSAAALQIRDFDTVEIGGVIDPASDPDDLQIITACHGVELDDVSGEIILSDITATVTEDSTCRNNMFYIHNLQPAGAVTATRLTGNGGLENTFRIEDRSSLTMERCVFTAPENTSRTPAAIFVQRVDTVTIDRTEGKNGYYGLYIFDCAEVDLTNLVLNGSPLGLNACNITDLDAQGCEIYGKTYCWKNGYYTFASDCWLIGDVEANGDSGSFVTIDMTGCFCSGMTGINQYSEILR